MDQLQIVVSGVFLLLTFSQAEVGQGDVLTKCSVYSQHCVFEDNNILSIINNMAGLEECRLKCKTEKGCRYITYYDYDPDHEEPFSGSCILFNQECTLYPPNTGNNQCKGCVTQDTQCVPEEEPCSAPVQGGFLLLRSNIHIKTLMISVLYAVQCTPKRQTERQPIMQWI